MADARNCICSTASSLSIAVLKVSLRRLRCISLSHFPLRRLPDFATADSKCHMDLILMRFLQEMHGVSVLALLGVTAVLNLTRLLAFYGLVLVSSS